MNVSVSYYTACGARPKNEDSVSILEGKNGLLAIVADGLGGYVNGEIASKQAVSTLNQMLHDEDISENVLEKAIQKASQDIFSLRKPNQVMRTTVAALWLNEQAAVASHVGDTRIYQFRDGQVIFQSVDHSVAQLAVLVGEITPDDIRGNRDRNKLIRSLGDEDVPKVDSQTLQVQPGDSFLLCSDGFWELVKENEMLSTLEKTENAENWLVSMREIVEKEHRPHQDNHSAIVIMMN